ncbi:splicing factor YJU2-like [Branchiostoma floridae]|uniref:Splicing factor YJU2 n=1 Tax=Branchiostoma floridae TaxID=7739 RepID=A0A9J7HNT2_BRAFL|nr:splicing factor YJU2-like [Branchiostoma floridae]
MSERKVLNKYYPPDFDPSKLPKLKLPKERQYVVRLMAPCNMRCQTCGEYIYKGKKFNARKETVQNMTYLGLRIFRFYIKCPRCCAEISFRTDPESTDYVVEQGATRNFQAMEMVEKEEERAQKEREEEELNNPMKVLENRTKDSKYEMDILENLEELRDLNQRQAKVDFEAMLQQNAQSAEERRRLQEEEEERQVREIMGEAYVVRRLEDDSDSDDETRRKTTNGINTNKRPTDLLAEAPSEPEPKKLKTWEKSVGSLVKKSSLSSFVKAKKSPLSSLVKAKKPTKQEQSSTNEQGHKEIPSSTVTSPTSKPSQEGKNNSEVEKESSSQDGQKGGTRNEGVQSSVQSSGLGLLGNYSDSSDSESSD